MQKISQSHPLNNKHYAILHKYNTYKYIRTLDLNIHSKIDLTQHILQNQTVINIIN